MRRVAVFVLILALSAADVKKPTAGAKVTTPPVAPAVQEPVTPKPTPAPAQTAPAPPPKVTPPVKAKEPEKVVEKLGAVSIEIAVLHLDTKAGDWKPLAKGQRLSSPLSLSDHQERVHVKVTAARKLHQVFVLLRNKDTEEEVGFIGKVDGTSTNYIVEVDLPGSGFEAGTYEMVLYLGDFSIDDSLEWLLGDLDFKGTGAEHVTKPRPAVNPLYAISYDEKPEIKHQFRQPEPRPPKLVSDAFTLLVLSPLLVLFILWIKIGINISNFPVSLSALTFHLGLSALFGVYALFWIKLTMFEALKYMAIPGFFTFVAGNRMLSGIAERRNK